MSGQLRRDQPAQRIADEDRLRGLQIVEGVDRFRGAAFVQKLAAQYPRQQAAIKSWRRERAVAEVGEEIGDRAFAEFAALIG